MEYFEYVKQLCLSPGPSGFETPAVKTAAALLEPLVDQMRTDRLGSVIGVRKCGKPGAKKVLLDAHLDEVGFIVTGHKDGFLQFRTLGGVDPRILPDRELTVLSDPPMLGVVAVKPPHIMEPDEADKAVPLEELYLDVGLDQASAQKLAPIGTPMVYREDVFRLQGDRIAGKSLDDRSCFAILLRTLELLQGEDLDVDVAVLGSCFEETSGDGALVATFAEHPDCAIAVDVTFASTQDGPKETGLELGGGPAVGIGPNCARWMVDLLRRVSKEEEIPFNAEVMAGNTGTNGWDMQVVREGIPVAIVSLPLRYMHTPLEVISQEDAEQCARLLAGFLRRAGKEEALCWKN
jgi:endoglucanase